MFSVAPHILYLNIVVAARFDPMFLSVILPLFFFFRKCLSPWRTYYLGFHLFFFIWILLGGDWRVRRLVFLVSSEGGEG